jgi:uncharacterized protein YjbI with pentapeptide repeats
VETLLIKASSGFCKVGIFLALLFYSDGHATADKIARAGSLGPPCAIDPLPQWEPQEQWVWKAVCEGAEANLAKQYGGSTDPSDGKNWPAARTLRSDFLSTILLTEPFRSALGRKGVRVTGARFEERIDLEGADIKNEVWIDESCLEHGADLTNAHISQRITFDGTHSKGDLTFSKIWIERELSMSSQGSFTSIKLERARVDGSLVLEGSKVSGLLDMDALRVDGDLLIRKGSEFADIKLRGAKIGRQLGLEEANFAGSLNMDSIEVGENLIMRNSTFQNVALQGATVGRDVIAESSTFSGVLDVDSLEVKGGLRLNDASFNAIKMKGTKVAGELTMSNSNVAKALEIDGVNVGANLTMTGTFHELTMIVVKVGALVNMTAGQFLGDVSAENLQVAGNLLLRDSVFNGDIVIKLSTVEGSLTLANSSVKSLDLSGTSIKGELNLSRIKWQAGSLTLRNTSAGAVDDDKESWPKDLRLSLGGFTYQRWGGLSGPPPSAPNNLSNYPAQWYAGALNQDPVYSRQPYEQLASVLKSAGYVAAAEDVLFEEKKRALWEEPASVYQKALQLLTMIFIGFGHRVYYSIPWTLLFIGIGALVVTRTAEARINGIRYGVAYSLDILIPLIKLRESHYKIDFEGNWRFARYYFYFHKLMGFVLASFLIAGLSGLTK